MNTFSHDEGNAIRPAVNDRASKEQSQQRRLLAASERLLTARTVPEVIEVLRDTARESVGADGIAVVLKDGDRCTYVAEDGVSTLWHGESFPQEDCVSGWAMRHKQTVSIRDVRVDERIPQEAYARTSVRSLVLVPIGHPEPVAALGAYWSEVADHDEATIERMEVMARLAAVAVENARLSTARDRAHALSTAQNQILELAVQEAPLAEKLTAIVREVEAVSTTGVLGSILLLDEDGKRLHNGAGPSLPPKYNAAIDGIEVGASLGSCGTAAFTGKAVFVSDIANDPLWVAFRDLALSHDLRACWSTPIRSASGKLLGTFAMYHRQKRVPQHDDLEIVDFVVRTVALIIERSRSEASVRRSEARYRQIVEGSEDFAIVTFDAEGRLTGWNRGAENIIGYAADDVIGRPGDFFYTEEDQATRAFHHEVERARREGRAANERWHLRADGKPFWGSGLMMPLAMDNGGFLKIFRDGTAEHDAEASVRANEERLRFLTDLEERLFRSADAEQAMSAATELLGRQIEASRCAYADVEDGDAFHIRHDFVAPGVRSSTGTYSLDLFGARAASEMRGGNVLVVRDVGAELNDVGVKTFWSIGIEAIICCPLIKDGRLTAMMAIHQDQPRDWTAEEIALTRDVVERCWAHVERVGSEARLRDSDERLRLAVTNAEVGFWDVDIINDVLIWPPRTKAMFGISPDVPVTMQDFYNGLHPDDREATSQAFAAAADPAQRALYDVDYRTIGKEDGALRWVAARGRGVFDDSGRCLRVAGTAVDITARKEAEEALYELNATLEARIERAIADRETAQEALRQSQKMEAMGQLTGGVAHDFNNLLTPIVGALDMLQRKGLGGEREQRLIDGAAKSADRAKTLVQRLLAFARRQPLQAVAVDVANLVDGMGDLVSSTTGPQIRVVVEVADDLPAAQADPNQLEMAILNLAVNARDAMPDGGTLRISAIRGSVHAGERPGLRAGDYIRLSVADTGAGMDEATIARAVEPFFSTKGIGKGTGLGLSMVHGLASQLGGALAIQSTSGLGTNVELWLPLSGAAAGEANLPQEPTKVTRAGSVLLVDDEELVRISTADMLADLGYDVTEASSGEEALGIINGGKRFNLLVTDHLMPGMTGTDLAIRVRSTRPDMAVLLVSGYAENEGIAPNLPRLTKPFRKDDLAASLAKLTS